MDAGADLIFPEAMAGEPSSSVPRRDRRADPGQHDRVRQEPAADHADAANLGVNMVIYPVTLLRLAMGAVDDGLAAIAEERHPGRRWSSGCRRAAPV